MDTLDTLGSYMERIQQLHPPTSFPLQSAPCSAGDSQGSLDIDMDVDRQMMIYVSKFWRCSSSRHKHANPNSHCMKKSGLAFAK